MADKQRGKEFGISKLVKYILYVGSPKILLDVGVGITNITLHTQHSSTNTICRLAETHKIQRGKSAYARIKQLSLKGRKKEVKCVNIEMIIFVLKSFSHFKVEKSSKFPTRQSSKLR